MDYFLPFITNEIAANSNDTWFIGDHEANAYLTFDGRPFTKNSSPKSYLGTNSLAAGHADDEFTVTDATNIIITSIRTLKMPLHYISNVFLQEDALFRSDAVNASYIMLEVRLSPYALERVLGRVSTAAATVGLKKTTSV